jgi:hypothetical protein
MLTILTCHTMLLIELPLSQAILTPYLEVRGTDTGPKQCSDIPTAEQRPRRAIEAARGVVAALRPNTTGL